ncbi:RNA polymerase subunit sigma [Paenibacillus sp. SC116]|uniref:sigma factor-like helix-turn-helix DNA-binding protein n=1 Tax=Paenibacillus sp. SC116 TaxID=2968986 RepID=UPI00215AA65E|nr:sigma factor-like helix-turn-helix DNA-binding protein [Paenibacillus sp. SC116]MCR8843102.1 RNA polymerase subunit sigma [Paenibacillus sp. SC116]
MGAVKVDTTKDSRKYTESYALNTAKGVEKLLRDRHRISSRRYSGDYAASDILIDLNTAIDNAKLSRRQAEAVTYLYGCDLTQAETANEMDVTQQAVQQFNSEACRKIAKIFRGWDYGEVSVEMTEEDEESA